MNKKDKRFLIAPGVVLSDYIIFQSEKASITPEQFIENCVVEYQKKSRLGRKRKYSREEILELRKKYTQMETAIKLGISLSTVSRIENGK